MADVADITVNVHVHRFQPAKTDEPGLFVLFCEGCGETKTTVLPKRPVAPRPDPVLPVIPDRRPVVVPWWEPPRWPDHPPIIWNKVCDRTNA